MASFQVSEIFRLNPVVYHYTNPPFAYNNCIFSVQQTIMCASQLCMDIANSGGAHRSTVNAEIFVMNFNNGVCLVCFILSCLYDTMLPVLFDAAKTPPNGSIPGYRILPGSETLECTGAGSKKLNSFVRRNNLSIYFGLVPRAQCFKYL